MGKSPKTPDAPPPVAPPVTEQDTSVVSAGDEMRKRLKMLKGRSGTLLDTGMTQNTANQYKTTTGM